MCSCFSCVLIDYRGSDWFSLYICINFFMVFEYKSLVPGMDLPLIFCFNWNKLVQYSIVPIWPIESAGM